MFVRWELNVGWKLKRHTNTGWNSNEQTYITEQTFKKETAKTGKKLPYLFFIMNTLIIQLIWLMDKGQHLSQTCPHLVPDDTWSTNRNMGASDGDAYMI